MTLTGILAAALIVTGAPALTADDVRVHTGAIDGAQYRVEVPSNWNGKLLLYNHGIYPPGYVPEEIELANRPEAKPVLLGEGYALAASLYSKPNGFSAREAVHDQTALLSWFDRNVGRPAQVLTWGASGGGLNAVLLSERLPHRIDGALAMCGPVAGGSALFGQALDLGFAVRTLLAPELEIVRIADPRANLAKAHQVIAEALESPGGRARLALANAFADAPGWSTAHHPRSTDVTEQIRQQTKFVQAVYDQLSWGDHRADLEKQAGGNPTGNTGVDYRGLLARSSERDLVKQAYRAASLDLGADLAKLAAAPRVKADHAAARLLDRIGTPTGRGHQPIVTLHPIGDGVAPEHERTYGDRVDPARIRQVFVNRGGHCQHTAAEELTALRLLRDRVETGRWPSTSPERLNAEASRFGPEFHFLYDWLHGEPGTSAPAFRRHHPAPLPRVA
ncbi:hypothetical protein [Amycolatopsis sp. BJA-103]|uniref:hypothetical protein n=1 Tax=Amycolatopsis sp. BJA-103 TaxID=1911175 RepID=UPI000C76AFD6|nr:hypothetical protein [Amycolatopsis sp. BJA-103]AUI63401.1 hypothetical protein BKN51_38145 [Amycolatopsis sp. BJA-103]PNE19247.1 hypothetical protein B1H26_15855 [Amycolatopsis sp. BJA-103]